MVAIENLVKSDKATAKQGNHSKRVDGERVSFIYHWTTICQILPGKQFWTDNQGWGTRSTNKAVAAYRRFLTGLGYTEVAPC